MRTPLDLPLALFVASALIGVWASYDPATSWRKLGMIVAAVALYYLLVALRVAPQLLETFVWLFVFGCCALTLYFVTQHDFASHPGKFEFITAIGLALNRVTPQLGRHVFDPNITSGALEIGLPLAVALVASEKEKAKRETGRFSSPGLLVSLSASAIIVFGLVMTSSRGAWLALAIVGGIAILAVAARDALRRYALPFGVIAALAGLIVVMRLGDSFVSTLENALGAIPAGNTAVSRVELWGQAWELVQDYYFTGSGLGVFPMVLSTYALLIDVPFLTHVHNLYLQIWLEQGLLGIVAFAWLVIEFYLWTWRRRTRLHVLASGGVAAVTVMLLHGFVDVLLYSSRGLPLMFVPMGVALASGQAATEETASRIARSPQLLPIMTIVAAFALIILLYWQPLAAMWHSNLGSVQQTRLELGQYHWPDRLVANIRADPALWSSFQAPITNFQRALSLDGGNVTANQRLGALALAQGNKAEALRLLRQAYGSDPANGVTNRLMREAY